MRSTSQTSPARCSTQHENGTGSMKFVDYAEGARFLDGVIRAQIHCSPELRQFGAKHADVLATAFQFYIMYHVGWRSVYRRSPVHSVKVHFGDMRSMKACVEGLRLPHRAPMMMTLTENALPFTDEAETRALADVVAFFEESDHVEYSLAPRMTDTSAVCFQTVVWNTDAGGPLYNMVWFREGVNEALLRRSSLQGTRRPSEFVDASSAAEQRCRKPQQKNGKKKRRSAVVSSSPSTRADSRDSHDGVSFNNRRHHRNGDYDDNVVDTACYMKRAPAHLRVREDDDDLDGAFDNVNQRGGTSSYMYSASRLAADIALARKDTEAEIERFMNAVDTTQDAQIENLSKIEEHAARA